MLVLALGAILIIAKSCGSLCFLEQNNVILSYQSAALPKRVFILVNSQKKMLVLIFIKYCLLFGPNFCLYFRQIILPLIEYERVANKEYKSILFGIVSEKFTISRAILFTE